MKLFDAHLIGIDPHYQIHVSYLAARKLEIRDGRFLGLKGSREH
jgi:hypothetical protein